MLAKLNWIVVPGGPGLSNIYLKHGLVKPFSGYKLHFYDVLGSPECGNDCYDINAMAGQIHHVAYKHGLYEYGLITHSFGNYLAMRALERNKDTIKAIIMLNPIPFDFYAWKNALSSIVKKIPDSVLKEIKYLSEQPDRGAELFHMLFPYYIGKDGADLPIEVPLNINTCNSILEKVTEYDDRTLVNTISIPLVRIVGENDPFFYDREILPDKTIIIPKVGHYPFFENAEVFCEVISNVGDLLYR